LQRRELRYAQQRKKRNGGLKCHVATHTPPFSLKKGKDESEKCVKKKEKPQIRAPRVAKLSPNVGEKHLEGGAKNRGVN